MLSANKKNSIPKMTKLKRLLLIALGTTLVLSDSSQALKEFSKGSTQFSADIYKQLAKKENGSFIVCPLSLDVILALFYSAAGGKTARQLTNVLHLPNNRALIYETFKKLSSLLKSTKTYNLTSANKVYLNDGFQASHSFKHTATNVFNSKIESIKFSNPEKSAAVINKWVEKKTKNKIKNLIKADMLKQEPAAVLINAIYFRGKWITKFLSRNTKKRPFHINAKINVQVESMETSAIFMGFESPTLNAKFLVMPYKGKDISMTFVLPNEINGLSRLEHHIDEVLIKRRYYPKHADVVLPKFKLETSIEFLPILQSMGLTEPFEHTANFSGFGVRQQSLIISKIIQKAVIEVEEKGTTAAAGTAGFVMERSRSLGVQEFIADHPFIYFIKVKDVIVFIGRYTGPS